MRRIALSSYTQRLAPGVSLFLQCQMISPVIAQTIEQSTYPKHPWEDSSNVLQANTDVPISWDCACRPFKNVHVNRYSTRQRIITDHVVYLPLHYFQSGPSQKAPPIPSTWPNDEHQSRSAHRSNQKIPRHWQHPHQSCANRSDWK